MSGRNAIHRTDTIAVAAIQIEPLIGHPQRPPNLQTSDQAAAIVVPRVIGVQVVPRVIQTWSAAQRLSPNFAGYLADAQAGRVLVRDGRPKKQGTLEGDTGRIEGHIVPLLGHLPVAAVVKKDVERFMHAVAAGETAKQTKTKPRGVSRIRGGRSVATRTIGLLDAIFTYAIDHGMRGDNPAHRVRKFAEKKPGRRLSDAEYTALGEGLRSAGSKIWPPAIVCTRFLALTGWRSGEALSLRWNDVDLVRRTATLPDTKSGRSMRPLPHAACDLLLTVPRPDGALVFPASGKGLMSGDKKFFRRIVTQGGCPTTLRLIPCAIRSQVLPATWDTVNRRLER